MQGQELRKLLKTAQDEQDQLEDDDEFGSVFQESDVEEAAEEGAPDLVVQEKVKEVKEVEWKTGKKSNKRQRQARPDSPGVKKQKNGGSGGAPITPDEVFNAVNGKDMTTTDLVRHFKSGGRLKTKEQQKAFREIISEHFTLEKKGGEKVVRPKTEYDEQPKAHNQGKAAVK